MAGLAENLLPSYLPLGSFLLVSGQSEQSAWDMCPTLAPLTDQP